MSDWLLTKYLQVSSKVEFNNLTIWVLHADKTPPHIGISCENAFFSLKINGKDECLAVKSLLTTIKKKQIPTLAIELKIPHTSQGVHTIFRKFGSRINDNETCLSPIVQLLTPHLKDLILIELLNELEQNHQINAVYGVCLPKEYIGIPSYTRETIQQRIHAIQPTQR
jgi:hypothetical protein